MFHTFELSKYKKDLEYYYGIESKKLKEANKVVPAPPTTDSAPLNNTPAKLKPVAASTPLTPPKNQKDK